MPLDPNKITFSTPAKAWEEALPVGTGKLGGMVFGLPYIERIQLNEDSVWSGGPRDRNNPSAAKALPKIRQLIFEGKISEAEELCSFALSGLPEEQRHYEPLGNLFIEFCGKEMHYSDYSRELDLDRAVVTTSRLSRKRPRSHTCRPISREAFLFRQNWAGAENLGKMFPMRCRLSGARPIT